MGARRAGEQEIRNITVNRTGTYQISLPIELVRLLRWQQGQKITVKKQGEKLIIEDWKS
jgi:antitoxin component of MazEF toxin-antitoxin module